MERARETVRYYISFSLYLYLSLLFSFSIIMADPGMPVVETRNEPLKDPDTLSKDGVPAPPFIDPVLEKKVMRKFDCYVIPQMMLLIILAYLDRSNIGI